MLVSVIIPTYNSAKFIKQTLKSALNQTYKNIEIIIVDDHSEDKTIKIIKNFNIDKKKIRVFKLSNLENLPSGSGSKARNYGIKKAKGELIAFLDSDDLWKETKIEKQVKSMGKNTDISFTKCQYLNNNRVSKESFVKEKFINFTLKNMPDGLFLYNPIRLSSVIIKKKVFNELNFSEQNEFTAIEDFELWLNLFFSKKKKSSSFLNEYLTIIRKHNNNLSKDYTSNVIKNIYAVSKFMINKKMYYNLRFFIAGIFFRTIQLFLKKYKVYIKKIILKSITILAILYFLIFYSPFFSLIGKPLLYHNEVNKNADAIIVFTGSGYFNYYNWGFQKRYFDIKKNIDNGFNKQIFILGRLQEIPQQKILEVLLINDKYDKNKIKLIYEEYINTAENIKNLGKILKKNNVNSINFITGPYNTYRSKLLWNKNLPDVKVNVIKTVDWPDSNYKWFKYSKNKKIILYEYLSIFYNKLFGRI